MNNPTGFSPESFTALHWQLFSYVENCVVNKGGYLESEKILTRSGAFKYPNGDIVPNYSELTALNDFERAGLLKAEGSFGPISLTPAGWELAARIRRHIAEIGSLAKFELAAPQDDKIKAAYALAYKAVTLDWLTTLEDFITAFGVTLGANTEIGGGSWVSIMTMTGADTWNIEQNSPQSKALLNLITHYQVARNYLAQNEIQTGVLVEPNDQYKAALERLVAEFNLCVKARQFGDIKRQIIYFTVEGREHSWFHNSSSPQAEALKGILEVMGKLPGENLQD